MDGLNPNIIELLMAIVSKQPDHITLAIKNLADSLKLDGDLLSSIINLALCKFDPANTEQNTYSGEAELEIKSFLSIVTPDLPF